MNRAYRVALLILVLLPIAIALPSLTGFFNADPMIRYSGLGYGMQPGLLPGAPVVDPSIGYIHQALGHLAASDIVHGRMPFWNPYEAAGVPLLGEMNASPFYPFMPALLLPHGEVWISILVQISCGLATFAVLSSLGLGILPALAGGILFEFNGTMAWMGGGWNYPAPCLPLLIYGIEKLRSAHPLMRSVATAVIAVAVAISIGASFIEIAFLNALLAGAWGLFRLAQAPRAEKVRFGTGLIVGAAAGLLLASPILIAFVDYLRVGFTGPTHSGATAMARLPSIGLVQKLVPYSLGPLGSFGPTIIPWGATGGYVGFAIPIVAVSALFGARERGLRRLLAGWVVFMMGVTFGFQPFQQLLLLVPGVQYTGTFRYLDMSCAFALAVLVAFALDDAQTVIRTHLQRRVLAGTGTLVAIFTAACLASHAPLGELFKEPFAYRWFVGAVAVAFAFGVAAIVASSISASSMRARFLALVVFAEALGAFIIPLLAMPIGGTVDLAGVDFLRAHLGFARYYSIGPLAPNYSAMFRISSIDYNDVPMPTAWIDYVHKHLDQFSRPLLFIGAWPVTTDPDESGQLLKNIPNYEKAGVKYIALPSFVPPDLIPSGRRVYRDIVMSVFELPSVAPYVSAEHCALTSLSRLEVHGTCSASSTLRRLELFMPGWAATVNGKPATVLPLDNTFQQLDLPSGNIDVRFSFVPPYMIFGYAGFAFGALLLAGLVAAAYRRARLQPSGKEDLIWNANLTT